MKLELRFRDGLVETFDTEKMTSSAPGGGIAGMMRALATYSPVDSAAPFGEKDNLAAGLWVHLYQYNVDKALANNARQMVLVGRFAIASEASMRDVLCVRRDGEAWLVRDQATGSLLDATQLNTFGSVFVQGYGGLSICDGLSDAVDVAEALGILRPGWTMADAADLFGLPESFVERATTAGYGSEAIGEMEDDDALE